MQFREDKETFQVEEATVSSSPLGVYAVRLMRKSRYILPGDINLHLFSEGRICHSVDRLLFPGQK